MSNLSVCIALLCGLAATIAGSAPASAQADFPNRPITWIVAYAPGGLSDGVARIAAGSMQKEIKQPIVIENRPGGNTFIGTRYLASTNPDGYHIGSLDMGTLVLNSGLFAKLPYDPVDDFNLIGGLVRHPFLIITNPKFPASSFAEFIAYAKAHPGKLSYGSAGNGSAHHIATEALLHGFGLKAQHVPYKGAAPALQDVMASHTDFMLASPAGISDLEKAGGVKVLAITAPSRMPAFPNAVTIAEAGLKNFVAYSWMTLGAPKGTPEPILKMLEKSLGNSLQDKDVQAKLTGMGLEIMPMSPKDVTNYVAAQRDYWIPLMKKVGLVAQ